MLAPKRIKFRKTFKGRTKGVATRGNAADRLRADVDYATSTAKTTYGTIGIKVWIFKGEVVEDVAGRTYSTGA